MTTYNLTQAAQQLGISRQRLRNWQANHKLQQIVADPTGKCITSTELETIRDYYHFPTIKVFGYHDKFYDRTVAAKIIDWYQHPSHRPYKYSTVS